MSVKFFGTITTLHGHNDDFRYNNLQVYNYQDELTSGNVFEPCKVGQKKSARTNTHMVYSFSRRILLTFFLS